MFDVRVKIARLRKALHPKDVLAAWDEWVEVWSEGVYKYWVGESREHFVNRVKSDSPAFLSDMQKYFNKVRVHAPLLLDDPHLFYDGYKEGKSVDRIISDFAQLEEIEELSEIEEPEVIEEKIPKSLLPETERLEKIKKFKLRASRISADDLEEALDESFQDIVEQEAQEQIEERLLTRKNLKRRRPDVELSEDIIYTANQQEVLEKRLASCKKSEGVVLRQRLAGVERSRKVAVSVNFAGPFYEFLEKFKDISKLGDGKLGKALKSFEDVKEEIDSGIALLESAPDELKSEPLDSAKENLNLIRDGLLRSMEFLLGKNFDSFTYNVKEQLRKIFHSDAMKELIQKEKEEKEKQQISE